LYSSRFEKIWVAENDSGAQKKNTGKNEDEYMAFFKKQYLYLKNLGITNGFAS
jgi:hypothetical protein